MSIREYATAIGRWERSQRKVMTKYIWMAVEVDEYELPIAVADSARELAEMIGSTKHNVMTFVSKGCSGRQSGRKIIRIVDDGKDL